MRTLRLILAVVVTLAVVFAARYFGPNRPFRVECTAGGVHYSHRTPRSHTGDGPAVLRLEVKAPSGQETLPTAVLAAKVKDTEVWHRYPPAREEAGPEGGRVLVYEVPHQPPTTRVFYRFEVRAGGASPVVLERDSGDPLMVKFKNPVPVWVWVPHVLCMFGGFFFLIWCALIILLPARKDAPAVPVRPAWLSWTIMFIGGVPFGIAMNWYAFGVTWEAFPFGEDVTDNKTQVALVVWGVAALLLAIRKGQGKMTRVASVIAALVVLAIYLIPHSAQVS